MLGFLARRIVRRYNPLVIGITGSVGKTTTKDVIFGVLSKSFYARKSESSFNNEIGIPLTVLGIEPFYTGDNNVFSKARFLSEIASRFWLAYGFPVSKYPSVLVLELGADRPGDIAYLTKLVRPTIGVVTAVGELPVHVEFYSSPRQVAIEKANLVKAIPKETGLVILNYEDQIVRSMAKLTGAPVKTFGFDKDADYWVSDINYFFFDADDMIGGLSFKIHKGESFVPMKINNLVAPHQIPSFAAAVAVGMHLGLNMVDIGQELENIELPKGRARLIKGIKDCIIIDDTYNSSPIAALAALENLKDFAMSVSKVRGQARRVAILGDMKELGEYTEEAHRQIGRTAASRTDILICVGPASIFTRDEAYGSIHRDKIFHFHTVNQVINTVGSILQPNDVVLVKGSQSIRLEKLVKAIMVEPENAKYLLCRQYGEWRDN